MSWQLLIALLSILSFGASQILAETKVTGQLNVQASNLDAFVKDPLVQDSFRTSIAELTNTDLVWVDVPSTLKTKRRFGAERRLSSNVMVNYAITIRTEQEALKPKRRFGAERRLSPSNTEVALKTKRRFGAERRLSPSNTEVALKTKRRLGAERRLSPSNTVANTLNKPVSITNTIPALSTTELTTKLQEKLNQAASSGAYSVTVTEINTPSLVTYTSSTTPSPALAQPTNALPMWNCGDCDYHESFAFTKLW